MEKKKIKLLSFVLSIAMLLSIMVVTPGEAKTKSKIRINKKKITLYVGKTYKLKVKGTKKKVKWKSSKKKIAKVSKKGVVKALKKGKTTITAKVAKKKLTCKVTVKKKKVSKKATASPILNPVQTTKPTVKPTQTVSSTPTPTATPEPAGDENLAFSRNGGYYETEFDLTMTTQPGYTIYYTTDGTMPSEKAEKYTKPLHIKDRSEDDNVLTSSTNVKKMCINQNSAYCYTPKKSEVAKATVIRAIAIGPAGEKSDVLTRSYFVSEKSLTERYPNAAVVSLVTDPDNLLNYETGIHALGKYYDEWKDTEEAKTVINSYLWHQFVGNYTQKGRSWERETSFELFDNSNKLSVSQEAGIRLHGGASRMYGQKSFNVYFRKDYSPDKKTLDYNLFPDESGYATDSSITKWKSFVLRNGGNDAEYTKFHCSFIQSLVQDRAFITQKSRPAVLYLNGEYWGVYNLAEKYSDRDIEENFGVDKDNVVVVKEGEIDEGDETEDMPLYEDLLSYAEKDMTDEAVYNEFCEKVDIQSMLDYYATEIYIANNDWPEKNFQLWRTREAEEGNSYGDTKWRWMLFDTEFSMGLYGADGTQAGFDSFKEAIDSEDADPLFASVIRNATFRQKFLETIKDIGSNNFGYTKAKKRLTEMKTLYKPLIDEHYRRWGYINNKSWLFEGNIQTIDTFLKNRYDSFIPTLEKDLKNIK